MYTILKPLKLAMHRVHAGNTNEHRTGTVASGLLNNYYPKDKYITTPEQIQLSNKRPDFTVERVEGDELIPHLFVEVKSLINSNFNDILDQLSETILETVASMGIENNLAIFVIAMKGTKIAFYEYHSYVCLLDEFAIPNYKGFIPLGFNIPYKEFNEINYEYIAKNPNSGIAEYGKHIFKVNVPSIREKLLELKVESTSKLDHPHIWDLLNKEHENYVHELFMHTVNKTAGKDIKD
jgi:hypothetical protein